MLVNNANKTRDFVGASPKKIKQMADDGITISTIAINPHSPRDVDIMKYIAHTTGGKYYRTDDPSKLPQIFIKEAKVVKRSLIFNQQFQPMLVLSTELTKGIQPSEVPPLLAYVATTPKPRSTVLMEVRIVQVILIELLHIVFDMELLYSSWGVRCHNGS